MTQDKPLVPPDADTSAAEDTPRPDAERPTAREVTPSAPETPPTEGKNTPEPQAPSGITFEGAPGTAPVRILKDDAATSTSQEEARKTSGRFTSPSSKAPATPPPPAKPGPAQNSFRAMSLVALLFLAVLLLLQTAAGIYFPSLYLPSEAAVAGVAARTANFGVWLTPAMADQLAMLPGYFWFLGGVNALLRLAESVFPALGHLPAGTIVFSLAACIGAFVALAGTYALGKATGLGRETAFAAGLILLSSLGFAPLAHFVSPDLLLAGVMAFALACLYKGWTKDLSFAWLVLGFLLTGLSTLLGGLPGLLIPLATSLLFLCWRGTLRRGHRLDAVLGFGVMLLIVLGWLGAVILFTEEGPYMQTLTHQVLAPLTLPLWPPQDPWWMPTALLCLALAPWLLVVLFVSWNRVLAGAWTDLKAARAERSGPAWLWISLIFSLLLLTACTTKPWLAVVPLLPMAALLLGKALLRLSPGHSRIFFLLLAVLFLAAAVVLGVCSVPSAVEALTPSLPAPLPAILKAAAGLPVLAVICAVAAAVLWKLTNRAYPGGSLAVTVLLITILVQPATLMLSPSLEGIVGERIQIDRDADAAPTQPPATPASPETPPTRPAVPDAGTAPTAPPVQDATETPDVATPETPSTVPPAEEQIPQPEKVPTPGVAEPAPSEEPADGIPSSDVPASEAPQAPPAAQPTEPQNTPSAPEPQPTS